MKANLFTCAILFLILGFSSCKKEDNANKTTATTTTATTNNNVYINFTLDGVSKSIAGATNNRNTGYGGGSYTSAGFFDFTNDVGICLSMPLDSIVGSDLQSLVGQKIPIGSCGGCPTNIYMYNTINGDDYRSYDTNNPYPANYVKFNSVTYNRTEVVFGEVLDYYYVTGEFNLKLSYGTTIKNVTNGTFKLLYTEAK